VLSVGVRCPPAEVVRREASRGDRTLGQARAQFDVVHAYAGYDVEVDTSLADPDECGASVIDAAAGHAGPTRLASRL
jgi:chloramphenicol 3-O phosphotransferase